MAGRWAVRKADRPPNSMHEPRFRTFPIRCGDALFRGCSANKFTPGRVRFDYQGQEARDQLNALPPNARKPAVKVVDTVVRMPQHGNMCLTGLRHPVAALADS